MPRGAGKNKPYARPEVFTPGEVLTDVCNKKWKLGKSIGSGGFGDIYLASDDTTKTVTEKSAQYVVKIEPHANGPLFVEIAFYLRAAKPHMIDQWKQQRKLDTIGMPSYVGNGNHTYKNQMYRFLILPRFGQDLYKLINSKSIKRLSLRSIQAVSLQIVDILEYIHSREFIHGDIKASNLLLGTGKKQQLFLLDYGLAAKFTSPNGEHLKYGPDLRKAHNGTLEYTSRDAHIGAFSRRGDLEILGYNMLEWLCGNLPWSNKDAPDVVAKQKQHFMGNIQLKKLYPGDIQGLDIIEKYLKYVTALKFEDKPNYNQCREILKKGLPSKITMLYLDDSLSVPVKKKPSKRASGTSTALLASESETDDEKSFHHSPKMIKLPTEDNKKRTTRTTKKVPKQFNWTNILQSNPEKMIHLAGQRSNETTPIKSPPVHGILTPAMLQILSKRKENNPLTSSQSQRADTIVEGTTKLTPAMKEILLKTKKTKLRKSMGIDDGGIRRARKIKKKAVVAATSAKANTNAASSAGGGRAGNVGGIRENQLKYSQSITTGSISSRSARHLRRNL